MDPRALPGAIATRCEDYLTHLSIAFDECFGSGGPAAVERGCPLSAQTLPAGPGLLLTIRTPGFSLLVLIPETLPLPAWYRIPDEEQAVRLATLASTWCEYLLPEEWEVERTGAVAVADLAASVSAAEPEQTATALPLRFESDDDAESMPTAATPRPVRNDAIYIVSPVANIDAVADWTPRPEDGNPLSSDGYGAAGSREFADAADNDADFDTLPPHGSPGQNSPGHGSPAHGSPAHNSPVPNSLAHDDTRGGASADHAAAAPGPADQLAALVTAGSMNRYRRLLPVPVSIVVRLAEKRIEVGQLLNLAPGTLITFNKNCEELLDLYVNNRLFCRGEAVKIGEKFGLKINELRPVVRREERVF